jgi:hypothetical protein
MWVVILTGVDSPSFGEPGDGPSTAAETPHSDATMAVLVDPDTGRTAKAISC